MEKAQFIQDKDIKIKNKKELSIKEYHMLKKAIEVVESVEIVKKQKVELLLSTVNSAHKKRLKK